MLVEKRYRRQGIGKSLVLGFLSWCREKKVEYVSVTASAQNQLGINFYRRLGFRDYELTLERKLGKGSINNST
jgi:ribosomal protein S18 acetylase RimI-like enzyme